MIASLRCTPVLAGGLVLSLSSLAACHGRVQADAPAQPPTEQTDASATPDAKPDTSAPKLTTQSEIGKEVLSVMDPSANPCEDFYRYACGGWLDRTELPADKPRFGRGFGEVRDRNTAALRGLLEQAGSAPGERGKIGRYYAACMDEAAVEAQGLEPLAPYLKEIDKLKRTRDVMKLLGKRHADVLSGTIVGVGLSNDFKDPDLYILSVEQDGLGLGDRSYYVDANQKQALEAYRTHVARMLTFTGDTPEQAAANADAVLAFETQLAQISKPRAELRDPEKTYHPLDKKKLNDLAKGMYWSDYLRAAGIKKTGMINVSVPEYVQALPEILEKTDIATIKAYLRYHLISNTSSTLTKEVIDTAFIFNAQLNGAKQIQPRWERCVAATTQAFPDLVAQSYVEKLFPGDSKNVALTMIKDIERAFEAALPSLAWMDDATRKRASEKMHAIGNKVGFPDKWRTYESVDAGKNYFENSIAVADFNHQRAVKKLGGRVDEQEWFIPASMVNAFYNPLQNEMVFPAGILQPPYFSHSFSRAMNYGAMGMVMGHELTHGFDDSGRKFDGQGVMQEWWDPEVSKRFEERAQCVKEAYDAVEVQPGVHINGALTLGENIADFGGIKLAYNGYKAWTQENGAEAPVINGLSNEQLLFVAFAQGWCTQSSPEFDRRMIVLDPHSPPRERVNLPLGHFPGFWETFQCNPGTPMHPEKTCEVW